MVDTVRVLSVSASVLLAILSLAMMPSSCFNREIDKHPQLLKLTKAKTIIFFRKYRLKTNGDLESKKWAQH